MGGLNDPRLARGIAIVRGRGVRKLRRDLWRVDSQSHGGHYLVDTAAEIPACTCPDFKDHGARLGRRCKHAYAALITSNKIEIPAGMTDDRKRAYSQDWRTYD